MLSINKLCPQSVLKHSVVRFQSFAMIFFQNKCRKHIKSPGSKTNKSYLICFWWSLFFRCRAHVPLDSPGQIPTRPISSAFTRGRASRHATLVQCPGSKTHKSYLICFQWSLFFLCRTNGPLDFPSQMPTRPISSAFTRGRASRHATLVKCPKVENPQVLSHLLSVVAIWSLFFPCRPHVPLDSPSQIPTRPISSAFTRGRASRHATLVQCPGSKTHKSYLICFF